MRDRTGFYRCDISRDGEPIRSIETWLEPSPKSRGGLRRRIKLGDTTGASMTYTYPGRGGGIDDYLSSALRKSWWADNCYHCLSEDRSVRLAYVSWYARRNGEDGELCSYLWHEVDDV